MAPIILGGNALQRLCPTELGWHWEKSLEILTSFSFMSLVLSTICKWLSKLISSA